MFIRVSLCLIKTWLNFTSNFLDQNNLKSKFQCRNELVYIRDFEAVQKTSQLCIIRFKNAASPRGFKPDNTLRLRQNIKLCKLILWMKLSPEILIHVEM